MLNDGIEAFMMKKRTNIIEAIFKAKMQTILKIFASRNFHCYCINIEAEFIMVIKKN